MLKVALDAKTEEPRSPLRAAPEAPHMPLGPRNLHISTKLGGYSEIRDTGLFLLCT